MSTAALLKTIAGALAKSDKDSLKLPMIVKSKTRQSLSAFYREYSQLSCHELDISAKTLENQLKDLVTHNSSLKDALGSNLDKFLSNAANEFRKNAIAFASKLKNVEMRGDVIVVDTSYNNYEQVKNIIKAGFNTTDAYDIHEFISSISKDIGIDISNVTYSGKVGFDVGHEHSNVLSAYGAVILNSIRRSKVDLTTDDMKASIDDLLNQLQNPDNVPELMELAGIDDIDLFNTCVIATVGLAKRVSNGSLNVALSVEPKLDSTAIRKIAASISDKVFPEFAEFNQARGRSLEQKLGYHLSKNQKSYFLKFLNNMAMGDYANIVQMEGSKKAVDMLKDEIVSLISTGKSKNASTNTKVKVNTKPVKLTTSAKQKPKKSTVSKPSVKVPPLRNISGQYISTTSLQILMQKMLHETIRKNMVRPNLRYQTGRFASSVKVEGITRSRDGALTAYLSYMRYPYATFEQGGKQGHKGYYPSRLINQSAREIAAQLTREKFTSVTIK